MIILLPTCERPTLFARLIYQIAPWLGPADRLIVHDDGSSHLYVDDVLSSSKLSCKSITMRSSPRNGKIGYWRTVKLILKAARDVCADSNEPVFYIADDLIMAPDCLGRALSFLDIHAPPSSKGEGHTRCLGVNLYTAFRTRAMGYPHEAYDADGERVPWIDGAFLTRGLWIPFLLPGPVDINWPRCPQRGSGVWAQINSRTKALNLWWYKPYVSLSHHDDEGKSMMNPWHDGKRPYLKTKGMEQW